MLCGLIEMCLLTRPESVGVEVVVIRSETEFKRELLKQIDSNATCKYTSKCMSR